MFIDIVNAYIHALAQSLTVHAPTADYLHLSGFNKAILSHGFNIIDRALLASLAKHVVKRVIDTIKQREAAELAG